MYQYSFLRKVYIENPQYKALIKDNIPMMSVAELYLDGYWITEIFGTEAVVVYETGLNNRPFVAFFCRIRFNGYEKEILEYAKHINDCKYNMYKDMLQ